MEGSIICYTGDNTNVHCWLESRRRKNRFAASLLMLACALDGGIWVRDCQLILYFRTYHNVTAVGLTRKTKQGVDELIRKGGSPW